MIEDLFIQLCILKSLDYKIKSKREIMEKIKENKLLIFVKEKRLIRELNEMVDNGIVFSFKSHTLFYKLNKEFEKEIKELESTIKKILKKSRNQEIKKILKFLK